MARASGQCALSSVRAKLVSGRIDLPSWLFVTMCGVLEFVGKGHSSVEWELDFGPLGFRRFR